MMAGSVVFIADATPAGAAIGEGLGSMGFEVERVDSSAQALAAAAEGAADMLLLPASLWPESGQELARSLGDVAASSRPGIVLYAGYA